MNSTVRYLIAVCISLGYLSMLYFLSLALHVPFAIALPLIGAGAFYLFRWVVINTVGEMETPMNNIAFLALVICLGLIIQKSYDPAYKYGGWDAWCVWNLHAGYLAGDLSNWKNLLINPIDHADYPLLVPGINGFFMRVLPRGAFAVIPFVLSFCFTLFVPVMIYLENLRKNVAVAILVLFLMAQDMFLLANGVSQYADIGVAFFCLAALICLDHARSDKRFILAAAASMGCCMWTKNEGIILAIVILMFHARLLFAKGNLKYFAGGIVVPLVALIVFKVWYAPPNDLVSGQGKETLHHIFETGRYQLIWSHFTEQLDKNYNFIKIGFFLYLLLCALERKWPDRSFFLMLTCMMAYLMIYVFSTQVLEWHLATSLDRLMLQLSPAMIYVYSQRFCHVHLVLKPESAVV